MLMTAGAMIVGMLPMAIGGAGEEQNAALARAVIGGLLFATPTTLLVVPYLFAILRRGNDGNTAHGGIPGGFRMNAIVSLDRQRKPAIEPTPEVPPEDHPQTPRGHLGRLFAIVALLALFAGTCPRHLAL